MPKWVFDCPYVKPFSTAVQAGAQLFSRTCEKCHGPAGEGDPSAAPPALAGCRVEQYAIRDRSMKYSGHSSLFRDGKEVGPVPRLAICRGDEHEVLLFNCDRRWDVLGMAGGYPNIGAAQRRAERIYPGISAAWAKTGVTRRQVKNYLDTFASF